MVRRQDIDAILEHKSTEDIDITTEPAFNPREHFTALEITYRAILKSNIYAEIIKRLAEKQVGHSVEAYGFLTNTIGNYDGIARDSYLVPEQFNVSSLCSIEHLNLAEARASRQNPIGWWHSHKGLSYGQHSSLDDANFKYYCHSFFGCSKREVGPISFRVGEEHPPFNLRFEDREGGTYLRIISSANEEEDEMIKWPSQISKELVDLGSPLVRAPLTIGMGYSLVVMDQTTHPYAELAYEGCAVGQVGGKISTKDTPPLRIICYDDHPEFSTNDLIDFMKEVKRKVRIGNSWDSGIPIRETLTPQDLDAVLATAERCVTPYVEMKDIAELERVSRERSAQAVGTRQEYYQLKESNSDLERRAQQLAAKVEQRVSQLTKLQGLYDAEVARSGELGQKYAFQLSEAQRTNTDLASRLTTFEKEASELREANWNSNIKLIDYETLTKDIQTQITTSTERIASLESEKAAYEREIAELRGQLSEVKSQDEAKPAEVAAPNADVLQDLTSKVARYETEIAGYKDGIRELNLLSRALREENRAYGERVVVLDGELAKSKADFASERGRLETQIGAYQERIRGLDAIIADLNKEYTSLRTDNEEKARLIEEQNNKVYDLESKLSGKEPRGILSSLKELYLSFIQWIKDFYYRITGRGNSEKETTDNGMNGEPLPLAA